MTQVKICGLKHEEALKAALEAGTDFIGLVFYPPSPRFVALDEAAELAKMAENRAQRVGLFVDPDNNLLDDVLRQVDLDMIQLHGAETPQRTAEIRNTYGLQVIRAINIASKDDLAHIRAYEGAADWFLFDSKPEGQAGGSGQVFDWTLLQGLKHETPWMLAGGLTPENVRAAILKLQPDAVDVSSGVESERGTKDAQKIMKFIREAKTNG